LRTQFEFNLPTVVFTPSGKSPFFSASYPQFRNAIDKLYGLSKDISLNFEQRTNVTDED
jgi:hypothetical protein